MQYYGSYRKPSNKSKSVWKRKASDVTGSFYPNYDSETSDVVTINELKSVTKKATIISRLSAKNALKNQFVLSANIGNLSKNSISKGKRSQQKTQKSVTNVRNENTLQDETFNYQTMNRRPSTTAPASRINSLHTAKQAYRNEKKVNQRMMSDNNIGSGKKTQIQGNQGDSDGIKEGLLGQYQRYQKLTKNQLIQKLISLEYLANGIFRKNKLLEQKVRELEMQNMVHVDLGTEEMSEQFQF